MLHQNSEGVQDYSACTQDLSHFVENRYSVTSNVPPFFYTRVLHVEYSSYTIVATVNIFN